MRTALYKKSSSNSRHGSRNPFFMKAGDYDSPSKKNHHSAGNLPFFNHFGSDVSPGMIQSKLTVGQPRDKYEREADAMAERVIGMPDPQLQRQTIETEEEEMPMLKAQSPLMQRKCTECEKEEESLHRKPLAATVTPFFQRKEANGGEVNDRVTASLESGKSGGQPLSGDTKSWMGNRFGTDFSHVRVHTDSNAVQMSRELNAQAFTYGSDIYFNQGKFNPGSAEGKHLLAHELTHTIQQGGEVQKQQRMVQRQPDQEQSQDPVLDDILDKLQKVKEEEDLLAGYTQCDFLDKNISYEAQYALYQMYKRGGIDRHISLSILGSVKNNQMQGIYKEDQGKPALMARNHGTFWWKLIPEGRGAIVFEAEDPPMMIFKRNIANDRDALADALRDAWEASSMAEKAIIIPPPSLQPCPVVTKVTLPEDKIVIFPDQPIEGKVPNPPPPKPEPGCDKEELSKRVDQCIEKSKQDIYKCHASLGIPPPKTPWDGVKKGIGYYACLEKARRDLLDCDRKAKQDTNCL